MRVLLITSLALGASVSAQVDPAYDLSNFRGVISTGLCAATMNNLAWPPTTPPGFQTTTGVAADTRVWANMSPVQFLGGHQSLLNSMGQAVDAFTVTGIKQTILLGSCQTAFGNTYAFGQGIIRGAAVAAPHNQEHPTSGSDIFFMPPGTPGSVPATSWGNFRHEVALTTPITVPNAPGLIMFAQYVGGEYQQSTTNGQTVAYDWFGARGATGGIYNGFAVPNGSGGWNVTLGASAATNPFHPQLGVRIQEPVLHACGYHGNVYNNNGSSPLTGETYEGLSSSWSDWGSRTLGDSTVFFHIESGSQFANGQALVLMNVNPAQIPITLPSPFGNILINPGDPFFTALGMQLLPLDQDGAYDMGPGSPTQLPPALTPLIGLYFDFQAGVVDPTLTNIALTNRSSIFVQS